jgi:DNA-binding MarR family transcriptional regulator
MGEDNYPLFKPSENIRDFQLFEEIERNPKVSQRELSHKFGIALGVINACIKRMIQKGWVQLRGIPPRSIAYYVTPKGFAKKSNLALKLLSYHIRHYAEMKKQISNKLIEMENDGAKRVAFYGISDEMEVAYITLQGSHMKLVGIMDEEKNSGKTVFGYRVISPKEMTDLNPDAILITSLLKGKSAFIKNLIKQKEWQSIKIFTI